MTVHPCPQPRMCQVSADRSLSDAERLRDSRLGHPITRHGNDPISTDRRVRLLTRDVLVGDVRAVGAVEREVVRAVVGSVAVDVVDHLVSREAASDNALHHPAVFHPAAPLAVLPDEPTDVAARRDVPREQALAASPRLCVQPRDPAVIGAEPTVPTTTLAAPFTPFFHPVSIPHTDAWKTVHGREARPLLLAYLERHYGRDAA